MKPAFIILIAVGIAGLPLGASGLNSQSLSKPAGDPDELSSRMAHIERQHENLWSAGRTGEWERAWYEAAHLQTRFAAVGGHYVAFNALPLTQPLDQMKAALDEVLQAITMRERSTIDAAATKVTAACNACHTAAGITFVRVPTPSPP